MNKLKRFKEIHRELEDLYERKNIDYGDSFSDAYSEYGVMACSMRLTEKLSRFKQLLENEAKVNDESIIDTLKDLSNYSIMTIIEMEKDDKYK